MKAKFVGVKHFGPTIDVTDPCYDKDVWCRINDLKIKEGDYRCAIWPTYEYYTDTKGKRHRNTMVARIGIYLGDVPDASDLVEKGFIGVDAGLAGFFNNKPDYNDKEWQKICDEFYATKNEYLFTDEGFFSSSGYGDGSYPLYVEYDSTGEIVSLEIAFI